MATAAPVLALVVAWMLGSALRRGSALAWLLPLALGGLAVGELVVAALVAMVGIVAASRRATFGARLQVRCVAHIHGSDASVLSVRSPLAPMGRAGVSSGGRWPRASRGAGQGAQSPGCDRRHLGGGGDGVGSWRRGVPRRSARDARRPRVSRGGGPNRGDERRSGFLG